VDLADEAVDVDDQAPVTGPGARRPRAPERLGEHPVELPDMPERERAQERPQRRGRHGPPPEHRAAAARAQDVAVVDRVSAQQHRRDQRHHLAARIRRTHTIAKIDSLIDQHLDPDSSGERRRQHDTRVRHKPLVVEATATRSGTTTSAPSLTI
jgi:hypothetical protein